MGNVSEDPRRADLRRSIQRDFRRYGRRDQGHRSFWRSLSVLGAIGWPIVCFAVGGAAAGRWLDIRWQTGVRWTLILLICGTLVGCWIAWHVVRTPKS